MHVGYFKVYRPCFIAKVREIFVLMIMQFHRNESSWNVRSRGTKVPRERMFHGTKVLGTFAPEERKFTGAKVPRSECSMERKFHGSESSLYGLFAPGNESAEERKGLESDTRQPCGWLRTNVLTWRRLQVFYKSLDTTSCVPRHTNCFLIHARTRDRNLVHLRALRGPQRQPTGRLITSSARPRRLPAGCTGV